MVCQLSVEEVKKAKDAIELISSLIHQAGTGSLTAARQSTSAGTSIDNNIAPYRVILSMVQVPHGMRSRKAGLAITNYTNKYSGL